MVTREMLGATKGTSDADSWVLIHGPVAEHVTRRFVLSIDRDSFTIGRSTQSQIVVDSGAASRQHARLSRVPGGWWIQDLGSLNGTYVNDVRVERGTIAHGDRVQIGDVFFKPRPPTNARSAKHCVKCSCATPHPKATRWSSRISTTSSR